MKKTKIFPFQNVANSEKEQCVACLNRPLEFLTSLFGINPTKRICSHDGKPLGIVYERSNTAWLMGLIYAMSTIIVIVANVIDLISEQLQTSKLNRLFSIGVILFEINILIIIASKIMNIKDTVRTRNGIEAIIAQRKRYGIDVIFDKNFVRAFRCRSIFYLSLSVVVTLGLLIYEFKMDNNVEFWHVCELIFQRVLMYIEELFIICFILESYRTKHIFQVCYNQIKHILKERLKNVLDHGIWYDDFDTNKKMFLIDNVTRMTFPIHNMLQKLQRMHSAIYQSIKHRNNTLNPSLLILLLTHILILIFDYYTVLTVWSSGESVDMLEVKHCETNFILVGIIWTIIKLDEIEKPGHDILNFLEGFPKSKLRPEEIAQIEILIITIRTQRPVMTASNIVHVRKNLLGTICATVVSYVLLALQFRASWIKK